MIGDQCVAANKTEGGGNSFQFPLYIYPTPEEQQFGIEKHANFAPAFVKALTERIGHAGTPEDTFHYLYAVLHSPTYRERYNEFLKRDFPRIPLPPDADTFALGAEVGKKLVAAHLLEGSALLSHAPGFPHGGSNVVDKMKPEKRYRGGKIHLNASQYFDNVAADVWNFRVGGYQPAAKWLDDRAGRTLSDADLTHYRKLLAAQRATLALLPDADAVFARMVEALPVTN
jgi:predicted helicase